MKRKTNIFNLDKTNNDTTFLTFSNYAEYLTGNFLSTATKLYPSTFLCFNLPYTEEKTVEDFKMFLMEYYENKLAVLRDGIINKYNSTDDKTNEENVASLNILGDNATIENLMTPLYYLIEGIHKFFNIELGGIPIVYKSDVVEQDYKGTYTDTLCIVNLNEIFESAETPYTTTDSTDYTRINVTESSLHGWTSDELETIGYESVPTPIFDNDDTEDGTYYNITSAITQLNFVKREQSTNDTITFNCIIPLFDITNIEHPDNAPIDDTVINDVYLNHIPFGIWLPDTPITISKQNGFSQNWSLVIGAKFSPLPYGVVEQAQNKDTTDADIQTLTYAQLLYQQNELHKKFNEYLKSQNDIKNTLKSIQDQVNVLLTYKNFESLKTEFDNELKELKEETTKEINNLKEIIAGLRWKLIDNQ